MRRFDVDFAPIAGARASVLRHATPISYPAHGECPFSASFPRDTVLRMRPDPTYKDIFAHAFMVEELMRWFVADLCNGRELVDALGLRHTGAGTGTVGLGVGRPTPHRQQRHGLARSLS